MAGRWIYNLPHPMRPQSVARQAVCEPHGPHPRPSRPKADGPNREVSALRGVIARSLVDYKLKLHKK